MRRRASLPTLVVRAGVIWDSIVDHEEGAATDSLFLPGTAMDSRAPEGDTSEGEQSVTDEPPGCLTQRGQK